MGLIFTTAQRLCVVVVAKEGWRLQNMCFFTA